MKWILNDLSLDNEYTAADQLVNFLVPILRLRKKTVFRDGLFCSRNFGGLQLTTGELFSHAIFKYQDKNIKTLILSWVSKSGPFWDDQREGIAEDYFEYDGVDVTDRGLGESARLEINEKLVTSLSSFNTSDTKFGKSPLQIQHGIAEEILGEICVKNIWTVDDLVNSIDGSIPTPKNWNEAAQYLIDKFDRLQFSTEIFNQLSSQPFSFYIVERLEELLSVLQQFIECRDSNGEYTQKNHETLENHFMGDKAWFSDESSSNKISFKHQLKFPDPNNVSKKIFAPFHGKIKTPQFRVHFPWPIRLKDRVIKILYIGPKITKS